MNKILRLLKGKSLYGLGKLTKIAWIFKEDPVDGDVISVRGLPEAFFLTSGGSCPDPDTEEEIVYPQKIGPLKGKIEIE